MFQRQLLLYFPHLKAAGGILFANPVKAGFIAALLGHVISWVSERFPCTKMQVSGGYRTPAVPRISLKTATPFERLRQADLFGLQTLRSVFDYEGDLAAFIERAIT